jgi:CO/xanthine dehydrogenase FAD-binding subunit
MIKTCWNKYHAPATVKEAVALLDRYDGRAQVLGGGTDLLLQIQQGLKPPVEAMIDPSRIPGLGEIIQDQEHIVIGCAVTHSRIIRDQGVIQHGTCLVEGCGVIGGPQVRNVGTLAGNVAHALPAGDGSISLLALGGEVEVAGSDGRHWVPMQGTYLGPGRSSIDHHRSLITRLRFNPTGQGEGSAFFRVMRPQGVALPMISMACRLKLDENKHIESIRITVGPAGPVPYLAEAAMEVLTGGPAEKQQFDQAADAVLSAVTFRSSKYRASREYREEMIRAHLPVVLARATERAITGQAVPQGVGL